MRFLLTFVFFISLCVLPQQPSDAKVINAPKIEINDVEARYSRMIWLADWQPSINADPNYGFGKFFYRVSRSEYPIDKSGNYRFEVYFLSDSYYPAYYYSDNNGDGIIDVYRCSTRIETVNLYVNGEPYNNIITNSSTFWLLFMGDYNNGIGDLGISFNYSQAYPKIYMTWSEPKPF